MQVILLFWLYLLFRLLNLAESLQTNSSSNMLPSEFSLSHTHTNTYTPTHTHYTSSFLWWYIADIVAYCYLFSSSQVLFFDIPSENIFEDGNHLYRFLDDDPLIFRCQNIPRGISEVKPKPITDISSRLRFLISAMLEAYTSEDGKSVDYRSIHGSEEFERFVNLIPTIQCKNVSINKQMFFCLCDSVCECCLTRWMLDRCIDIESPFVQCSSSSLLHLELNVEFT